MEISSFEPKSAAGPHGSDTSRLGFHAVSAVLSELPARGHGIVIAGLADDTGVRNVGGRPGAKEGPAAARQRLYKFTTGAYPMPVYDLGDLLPESDIEATHTAAASLVREIAKRGFFPLVIGGGHDLGFPHALGVLESGGKGMRLRVCNIDAHLDVRPTAEGITSGSPWYLLGEHPLFQERRGRIDEFGLQPHCNAPALVRYASQKGFGMHWLEGLRKKKRPVQDLFARLLGPPGGQECLVVSLDIDSVRFAEAPGCSAPQTLGFRAEEAIEMSFLAGSHPRVRSFGIFELSPPLDPDGRTALLVAHCINACLKGFSTRRKVKKK